MLQISGSSGEQAGGGDGRAAQNAAPRRHGQRHPGLLEGSSLSCQDRRWLWLKAVARVLLRRN